MYNKFANKHTEDLFRAYLWIDKMPLPITAQRFDDLYTSYYGNHDKEKEEADKRASIVLMKLSELAVAVHVLTPEIPENEEEIAKLYDNPVEKMYRAWDLLVSRHLNRGKESKTSRFNS